MKTTSEEHTCVVCGDSATGYRCHPLIQINIIWWFLWSGSMEPALCVTLAEYSSGESSPPMMSSARVQLEEKLVRLTKHQETTVRNADMKSVSQLDCCHILSTKVEDLLRTSRSKRRVSLKTWQYYQDQQRFNQWTSSWSQAFLSNLHHLTLTETLNKSLSSWRWKK